MASPSSTNRKKHRMMSGGCEQVDDITYEILSYLPAKTLFKLRSLCKSFHKLISGDDGVHFLLTHSSHNENSTSGFFLLDGCKGCLVDLLLIDPHGGVRKGSIDFLRAKTRFLASAGGLVFFLLDSCDGFCVYNPARGTRSLLPAPPGQDACGRWEICRGSIAISFSGNSTDYKLVYLTRTPEWSSYHWLRIYDSAAKGWTVFDERLDVGPRCLHFENPVVLDETVYWVSDCWPCYKSDPYLVSLDLRRERTSLIRLPGQVVIGGGYLGIARSEESLCVIYYCDVSSSFMLWMMRRKAEDIDACCWVKFHEMSMTSMGLGLGLQPGHMISFTLVNMAKLLVFTVDGMVCGYTISDRKVEVLRADLECWGPTLIPYCNTLRPCGEEEERC